MDRSNIPEDWLCVKGAEPGCTAVHLPVADSLGGGLWREYLEQRRGHKDRFVVRPVDEVDRCQRLQTGGTDVSWLGGAGSRATRALEQGMPEAPEGFRSDITRGLQRAGRQSRQAVKRWGSSEGTSESRPISSPDRRPAGGGMAAA